MSAITLQLPDELAERLRVHEEKLPQILELGLRELNADMMRGFQGAADVLEFLAALPTPEEILSFQPSEQLEQRVRMLLDKSRAGKLTRQEEDEWEQYQYLEHLVRMAKTAASSKLDRSTRA